MMNSAGRRFGVDGLYRRAMVFGCVANLECHAVGQTIDALGEEIETVDAEVFLVCRGRIVAVADIEDIVLDIAS